MKRIVSILIAIAILISIPTSLAYADDTAEPSVNFYLSADDEFGDEVNVSLYMQVPEGISVLGISVSLRFMSDYFTANKNDISVNPDFGTLNNNISFGNGLITYLNGTDIDTVTCGTYRIFSVVFKPKNNLTEGSEYTFEPVVGELYDENISNIDYVCDSKTVTYGEKFSADVKSLNMNPTDYHILQTNKQIKSFNIVGKSADGNDVIEFKSGLLTALNVGEAYLNLISVTDEKLIIYVKVTLSDERHLRTLTPSVGKMTPQYQKDIFNYNVLVPIGTKTLSLNFSTNSKVTAVSDKGNTITLDKNGNAKVKITAVSQSGLKQIYTVNITSEKPISASKFRVGLSFTKYRYNNKTATPKVTVKDQKGKTVSSKYYTISYSKGRKSVGKYAVTATFKGIYTGKKTVYFTIVPKGTTIKSLKSPKSKTVTVKWNKQSSSTTGYQIQYSQKSNYKSSKTVSIGKNSTTSKSLTKLSRKKYYYVRIRTYKTVGKTKYYSDWSSSKKVRVK